MNNQEYLNLALNTEKSGIRLYENLDLFSEIFGQINKIRKNGILLLYNFAKENGYNISKNYKNDLVLNPNNLFEALILAMNYELNLAKTYDTICQNCDNDELKDIFFRLWATSNNEYLMHLKEILKLELKGDSLTENTFQNDFSKMIQNISGILSGKAGKNDLSSILSNPNFSFFSGLALGAMSTEIIIKNLNQKEDKKDV